MVKSKSTRTQARKLPYDALPTPAERRQAIRKLRKSGGAHIARPANGLIHDAIVYARVLGSRQDVS
jgi:hypothetical protein